MGKKSRRNRKKNPKQFKKNQENAIKKMKLTHCGQQQQRRTKGHMLVNMNSKRMCKQAKSAMSRQLNTMTGQYIHRDSCGQTRVVPVVPGYTSRVVHLG